MNSGSVIGLKGLGLKAMDLPMFLGGLLPGLLANLKRLLGVPIFTIGRGDRSERIACRENRRGY